jgi:WD repeat and SOF domain-containing protein 1
MHEYKYYSNVSLVPAEYNLEIQPKNPSLPHAGSYRLYLDGSSHGSSEIAYPPRPKPGSVADLDILMRHCDFATNNVGFSGTSSNLC